MMVNRESNKEAEVLKKLLSWFRDHVAANKVDLKTATVPDWFMDWDDASEDAQRRADWWEVICFHADEMFPVRIDWYHDTEIEIAAHSEMGRQLFVNRSYDPNEFALLDQLLEPGMTFVDVGANMGFYSIFASKKVGAQGRVISFEPSRREVEALLRNVAINRLFNVTVSAFAIGARAGQANLSVASSNYNDHNSLGQLSLVSTMPTLRFSTDRVNFHWCGLNNGTTRIPIGQANQLEVLIYSDQPFHYELSSMQIVPEEEERKPWVIQEAGETGIVLPGQQQLQEAFSNLQVHSIGELDLAISDSLQFSGSDGAGLVLRAELGGSLDYTLVLQGQGKIDEYEDEYPVEIVSLDEFFVDSHVAAVDVIKIDVEGGDLDALRGASDTVKTHQPIIIVEVVNEQLSPETLAEIKSYFDEHGYVLFDVAQGQPRLIDLCAPHGSNVIASPQKWLARIAKLGGISEDALAATANH